MKSCGKLRFIDDTPHILQNSWRWMRAPAGIGAAGDAFSLRVKFKYFLWRVLYWK